MELTSQHNNGELSKEAVTKLDNRLKPYIFKKAKHLVGLCQFVMVVADDMWGTGLSRWPAASEAGRGSCGESGRPTLWAGRTQFGEKQMRSSDQGDVTVHDRPTKWVSPRPVLSSR
ncbi:MAG TPA: hypothetical protein VGG05_18095 [Pseudonocardiaceae bacterium]